MQVRQGCISDLGGEGKRRPVSQLWETESAVEELGEVSKVLMGSQQA